METAAIFAKVDHTLLSPTATRHDIFTLCDEAITHKTASVCIPPSFVAGCAKKYAGLNICTVIGFPLGYSTAAAKEYEINEAISNGAAELDVVINIGNAKMGAYTDITSELTALKKICGTNILKVIIETCYLNEQQKIALCKCVTDSGADYIKTSTGFGSAGATLQDIALFKRHIGPQVKIKASGGLRTREDFAAFIKAGAARLGTSSAVKILTGENNLYLRDAEGGVPY